MANETVTFEKVLEPLSQCFTPAVARKIADLRADPGLQGRVDELTVKSSDGTLTESERHEYEAYVRASKFISILQSKARLVLRDSTP